MGERKSEERDNEREGGGGGGTMIEKLQISLVNLIDINPKRSINYIMERFQENTEYKFPAILVSKHSGKYFEFRREGLNVY